MSDLVRNAAADVDGDRIAACELRAQLLRGHAGNVGFGEEGGEKEETGS